MGDLEAMEKATHSKTEEVDQKTVSNTTPQLSIAYTAFTRAEKWLITLIMGLAMFFSPFTANIYFPAIPTLATAFSVSLQKINVTITAYIVLQGVTTLSIGDLADKMGRRPVYLLTFAIYVGASVRLGCNRDNCAALVALRMLQSAGRSATAVISYSARRMFLRRRVEDKCLGQLRLRQTRVRLLDHCWEGLSVISWSGDGCFSS
jgi:hypothetical protein